MKSEALLLASAILFIALRPVDLVAADGAAPAAELTYEQLQQLRQERKNAEIIAALDQKDLTAKAGSLGQNIDRLYYLRGLAYAGTKDGASAEADFKAALENAPEKEIMRQEYLAALADNYRINLKDPAAALAAYRDTIDLCFSLTNKGGSTPVQATIDAAAILREEGKYDEALEFLNRYDEALIESLPRLRKITLLRAFGAVYLAKGKEKEANACMQKALELEASTTP